MVLSTKEHHEIMESISIKCSTRYSLLPTVECIPPNIDPQEPLSGAMTSSVSSLMAEIDSLKKIEGEWFCLYYCQFIFMLLLSTLHVSLFVYLIITNICSTISAFSNILCPALIHLILMEFHLQEMILLLSFTRVVQLVNQKE